MPIKCPDDVSDLKHSLSTELSAQTQLEHSSLQVEGVQHLNTHSAPTSDKVKLDDLSVAAQSDSKEDSAATQAGSKETMEAHVQSVEQDSSSQDKLHEPESTASKIQGSKNSAGASKVQKPKESRSQQRHQGATAEALRRRRWSYRGVAASLLVMVAIAYGAVYGLMHVCAPDLSKFYERSYTLYDKAGNVIYSAMNKDDYHRILTTPSDVDPLYIKMLLAAEDERFYHHLGVDVFSIGRALISNLRSGSVVSGASTLAMQVCRMLEPKERTLWGKAQEALGALYLTHYYGREQLLSMYLTLAPFGGNIEGVSAASYIYFKQSPKNLTPAQAALLVALPRAPEVMRPDRYPERARYYRNEVLKKAVTDKIINADILEFATQEPIPRQRFALPNEGYYLGQSIFTGKLITPEIKALREYTARIIGSSLASSTKPPKGQFDHEGKLSEDDTVGQVVSAHLGKALDHELEHLGNHNIYNTKAQVQRTQEFLEKKVGVLGRNSTASSKHTNVLGHVGAQLGRDLSDVSLGSLPHELFSTIDPKVQQVLMAAVDDYKHTYLSADKQESLAIVVVDNESFEVLGYVGALGPNISFVDAALAIRSPGSALKPFAYALAFEQGLLHPNSVLLDSPQIYKSYQPRNYDRRFYGELTASKALQASLNLPAVEIMRAIGPVNFVNMLNEVTNARDTYDHSLESDSYIHGRLVLPAHSEPSLSLVLGGCGISLFDLTQLYAALAHDGGIAPLKVLSATRPSSSLVKKYNATYPKAPYNHHKYQHGHEHYQVLLSSAAARATYNILEGTPAPSGYGMNYFSSGPKISYKTGTSYKHRDAWALGSSNNITVGVWTGRNDGSPHETYTGYALAAPILFKVLGQLTSNYVRKKRIKDDVLLHARPPLALSKVQISDLHLVTKRNEQVSTKQELATWGTKKGSSASSSLAPPLSIAFPANQSKISLGTSNKVLIKFSGGVGPYYVLVNDELNDHIDYFEPHANGFYNITIIDSLGNSVSSQVQVLGL